MSISTAYAATGDNVAQPMYLYLSGITADLSIDEITGVATCSGTMLSSKYYPVKIVVNLQQYANGFWNTIRTWSSTGNRAVSCSGSYAVYSGYTYRTFVTAYIYDADGNFIESGTKSRTVFFP